MLKTMQRLGHAIWTALVRLLHRSPRPLLRSDCSHRRVLALEMLEPRLAMSALFPFGSNSVDQIGIFRPSSAMFQLDTGEPGWHGTPGEVAFQFGVTPDAPIAGDFDGNGVDEVGVFRNESGFGYFYRDFNRRGWEALPQEFDKVQLGLATDQPLVGDWNSDGIDELGVFRPATGDFFLDRQGAFHRTTCRAYSCAGIQAERLLNLSDIQSRSGTFVAVAGNWDGVGGDDVGVFYIDVNGIPRFRLQGVSADIQFGLQPDRPVVGDWNGDAKDEVGVYRVTGGLGYLIRDFGASGFQGDELEQPVPFGVAGDKPIAGNWGVSIYRAPNARFYELELPGWRAEFDTLYGGIVNQFFGNPNPGNVASPQALLFEARGAAFNTNWDPGADPTQAGANGVTPFPIARLGTTEDGFYVREVDPTQLGLDPQSSFVVEGYAPFFWLSFVNADDFIPGMSRANVAVVPGSPGVQARPEAGCAQKPENAYCWYRPSIAQQTGWILRYSSNLTGFEGGLVDRNGNLISGVPIYFEGTASRRVGVIMPGNTQEWNRGGYVPATILDGRVASRVRVSFKETTDSGAFAGMMFRKTLPATGSGSWDTNTVYAAPGYQLNVNRNGVVQVLRWNGQTAVAVWNKEGRAYTLWRDLVRSAEGLLLEVRTNNDDPRAVEIWINGEFVHADTTAGIRRYSRAQYQALPASQRNSLATDTSPIVTGNYFALHASSASGRVRFADRAVFDLGTRFRNAYVGQKDGYLKVNLRVENVSNIVTPRTMYAAQVPIAFLDPVSFNKPDEAGKPRVYVGQNFTDDGSLRDNCPGMPPELPPGVFGILRNDVSCEAAAFWAGNEIGTAGVLAVPIAATVARLQNGALVESAATSAHAYNANDANGKSLQLSPLPFGSSMQVSAMSLTSLWAPVRREFRQYTLTSGSSQFAGATAQRDVLRPQDTTLGASAPVMMTKRPMSEANRPSPSLFEVQPFWAVHRRFDLRHWRRKG